MQTKIATTAPLPERLSQTGTAPIDHVQVVQHLNPGGIEALALDLLGEPTAPRRHGLLSLEGNAGQSVANWPRLGRIKQSLHWFGKTPGISPLLVIKLIRFFKTQRVRVVHTHHIGPLLYAGIAARIAGVTHLIHTEHDAWHLASSKRRWLQRAVLQLTRPLLVADAELVADNMRRFLGQRSIRVIRNGIDCERFVAGDRQRARDHFKLPQEARLIGTSGRLEPVKGQRYLIEALALMPDDYHLAVAGCGSQAAVLTELASRCGVPERVHFLGLVEDMPRFYQALDLFCLPSLNEGFPLSSLEAQACSIPAAVTDVGAARETLCPLTGCLLPPADPIAMAQRLEQMSHHTPDADPRDYVLRSANLCQTRAAYSALVS